MLSRAEIKSRARSQIKGNIGILFVISLVVAIISILLSATFIGGVIVAGPLMLSMAMFYRGMSQGERPKVENLLEGFKQNFAGAVIAYILQAIFLFLWSLLFFIPGIIKAFSYSMTYYILADNPEMTATDAITESRRIMKGNKFRLFVQELSFLGWALLAILTIGFLFIWLAPYIESAKYNLYLDIKGDAGEAE